ncbi:hypothetical protein [Lymphocystis disease virus 2]|uniref:Uncharacterized protein n=1 Tax=Lymphocystis disease virus 2 TaxID=159183 RepID=A0A6F8X1T5_9VIRU|nr:hypothetical protein [Lymphocystis disease virus 2]
MLTIVLIGWMMYEKPLPVFICILIISTCFILNSCYNIYAVHPIKKCKLSISLVSIWTLFFGYVFLSIYIMLTSYDIIDKFQHILLFREICKNCNKEMLIKYVLFIVLNTFNIFLALQIIFSTVIVSIAYNTQRSFRLTNIIA